MEKSGSVFAQVSVEELQQLVRGVTTTEGRLAVSAGVLVLTLVLVGLAAPVVIVKLGQTIRERVLTDGARETVDVLSDYFPTAIGVLVLRVVQFGVLVGAGMTLLAVWGLVDVAVTVVEFVGASMPWLLSLGITALLFVVGYVVSDLYGDFVEQFADDLDRVTDHQREILLRLGHVGIIVLLIMGVLTLWGIDLSGLLVGAGFLGIVVGLAARQTLGSIIAGFVLMFSRPFTIGDWVQVGDHEGIVTDITIMNTRLQNFDGESIVMPNDTVSNRPITNRSKLGRLRVRADVGIDYEDDPEHAEEVAFDTIAELDAVADNPIPDVVPKAFGDSAIVLELHFWIDHPTPQRRWRATEAVIHAVNDAFKREDITIPYPQRELSNRGRSPRADPTGATTAVDVPEEDGTGGVESDAKD